MITIRKVVTPKTSTIEQEQKQEGWDELSLKEKVAAYMRKNRLRWADEVRPTQKPPQPQERSKELLQAQRVDAFLQQPAPTPIVEGILHEKELSLIYGQPGSGKSLVALSLSMAICGGKPWAGHSTAPAAVLFCALEGAPGMAKRVRAARTSLLWWPISHRLRFLSGEVDLFEDSESLAKAIRQLSRPPSLLVVDTLARSSGAADENSAMDVGKVIANIQRIQDEFSTAVLLVHHSRKTADVERGSTCLRAACDMIAKVEKAGERTLSVSCEKSKDAEPFSKLTFNMVPACSSVRLVAQSGRVQTPRTPDWFTGGLAEFAIVELVRDFGQDDAPTAAMLQRELGCSRATVNRRITSLVTAGYLEKKVVKGIRRLRLGSQAPAYEAEEETEE